jgi:hypothetical protein
VHPYRLLCLERRDESAAVELVLKGFGGGFGLEDVVYPFRVGGAQVWAFVGDAVEDEGGWDCDTDFTGIEVGRVRDEVDVVGDYNGTSG